jgi:cell division protein FtsZ
MPINITAPELRELKPRIVVLGVGGAGGNAINNMLEAGIEGVEFYAANTDAQALKMNFAECKIQLGANLTRGLGAGAKADIGQAAADESMNEIISLLQGANMVFVTAGMGGGTGTGAAPVIAKAAKDLNILTVGVVTKPFMFEGPGRIRVAEKGLEELRKYCDTMIVIPNQNLFKVANEKTTFPDAFRMADNVLMQGVKGITDLIVKPGLINLDFADIETVMSGMGKAMMGMGEAEGEGRAIKAAEAAIANPLIDEYSLKGARGLLINIIGGNDITLFEVNEAANKIRSEVDPSAEILVGTTFDDTLAGKFRVSIVATGLNGEVNMNKPVVSMIRHIQNRNNSYTRPATFSGNSYSSVQASGHMATNGATALDMNAYPHQEQHQDKQESFNVHTNYKAQQEQAQPKIKEEINHDHSEMNMDENSLFGQSDPVEFVEESFEKVENETQLFTNDEEVNHSISTQGTFVSEAKEELVDEKFSELSTEDKNDLEIPAFLRRQTN